MKENLKKNIHTELELLFHNKVQLEQANELHAKNESVIFCTIGIAKNGQPIIYSAIEIAELKMYLYRTLQEMERTKSIIIIN